MVAVFAGFAAGRLVMFQQLGFGLAIAVLLDATVVRSVLVPASMKLLGNRNWYFPSWLEWIPNISIEGHIDELVPQAELGRARARLTRSDGGVDSSRPSEHRAGAPAL